jgi:hypothetical protein
MGLTYKKVWNMFKETDAKFKETDAQFKEMSARMKETDRQIKETSRMIGNLGGRLGDLAEHLVIPNILEKFNKRGYVFGKAAPHVRYHRRNENYIAEVDILLENGDTALAVEVKTAQDVKYHIERMKKLRRYADEHGDQRKLLGAVAGAIASPETKAFALKSGFLYWNRRGTRCR